MRAFLLVLAVSAVALSFGSSELFEETWHVTPETALVEIEEPTGPSVVGMKLLQDMAEGNQALDEAASGAQKWAASADAERMDLENQAAEVSLEEDRTGYGWWNVNELSLLQKPPTCDTVPAPHYKIVNNTLATHMTYLHHYGTLCKDEIAVKDAERKSKEKMLKSKKNACEKTRKKVEKANKKSKAIGVQLADALKKNTELKVKCGKKSKALHQKFQKQTKESVAKVKVNASEATTKHIQEVSVKKTGSEKNNKKMTEVVFKKNHIDNEMRSKIYKGWEVHLKKEKKTKKAKTTAIVAEEKKCKASDVEKAAKAKKTELGSKKQAEKVAKERVSKESARKTRAKKTAKEVFKKGKTSVQKKCKELRTKSKAEKAAKTKHSKELLTKESTDKESTTKHKKAVSTQKTHLNKKIIAAKEANIKESRNKRVSETVQKMRKLRVALKGANELYNKTSSTSIEKKNKCEGKVKKSHEALTKAHESNTKTKEKCSKTKSSKEAAKKVAEKKQKKIDSNPYNDATRIANKVLKMNKMWTLQKEKEAKKIKSMKESCAKNYTKVTAERDDKESAAKRSLSVMKEKYTKKAEKSQKYYCKTEQVQTAKNNNAEDKFWTGKIDVLKADFAAVEKQDVANQHSAVLGVCQAAHNLINSCFTHLVTKTKVNQTTVTFNDY
jgi:hypothetical protein